MMWLSTITEKIKDQYFWAGFIALILFISPGFTFIYLFSPDTIAQFDILKLLLTSVAVVTPLVLLNLDGSETETLVRASIPGSYPQ